MLGTVLLTGNIKKKHQCNIRDNEQKYKPCMGMISVRTTNKYSKRQKKSTILDEVVREYPSKEEKINRALNEAKDQALLSGIKKSQVEGTITENVLKVAHQRNSHRSVIYFHALYLILALILVVIKNIHLYHLLTGLQDY